MADGRATHTPKTASAVLALVGMILVTLGLATSAGASPADRSGERDQTRSRGAAATDVSDAPGTGSVTLDQVLVILGHEMPHAGRQFSYSVTCDSGTVPNPAPSLRSTDEPLVVATGVKVGDSCTIVQTNTPRSSEVSIAPDDDPSTPKETTVTITSEGEVLGVVVTNICEPPDQHGVGSLTLDKVLAGDDVPEGDPSFTFEITCESGTVTSPASIAASDPALVVATGVHVGDSCTITETGAGGADAVSFVPDDDAATSTSTTVTVSADDEVVAVVATNTFNPDVAPTVTTPTTPSTPTTVSGATVAAAADSTGPQVLGTAVAKELPATGADILPLTQFGVALLLAGATLALSARRRTGTPAT